MLGHMFLCLSQTWLNKVRTNIGLSPTICFLNENDSLAFLKVGKNCHHVYLLLWAFLRLLSSLSLLAGFFRGQGRTYLATP